ncbi:Diacylglycerol kinase [Alienimonas californiensis]|uniref:Diacylglycerol kinase n=1 Tax=Alienimonas californiensis TaxID=2527989 RepID=A0A517P7A6_9PLAN|nr:Diacylglycerol kinase [Alienimonas californiensis]
MIFNPAAGRRRARRRLAGFLARWGDRVTLRPTARPGHAAELAAAAVREGFETIAAAGGDGTVHEVADGLLRAADQTAGQATDQGESGAAPVFAVVPIGSANDYAHSLQRQFGTAPLDAPEAHPVDVGRLSWTAADGAPRDRYFVCCCGAGLPGRVTLESRKIGWLQGVPLYGLAALRALRAAGPPEEWTVQYDDEPPTTGPTQSVHALLGRREGGFLLAPDARLDDGLFDTLRLGPASRWGMLKLLPGLARRGPPTDHPHVELGRRRSIQIDSPSPLAVHADGELALIPADAVRSVRLDLLPGRLRAKVCAVG